MAESPEKKSITSCLGFNLPPLPTPPDPTSHESKVDFSASFWQRAHTCTQKVLARYLSNSWCVPVPSVRQRCLEEQRRRRQRATRKISTFIGTFMLCFAPYVITRWAVVGVVGCGAWKGALLTHCGKPLFFFSFILPSVVMIGCSPQTRIVLPSLSLLRLPPHLTGPGIRGPGRLADLVIRNMPRWCFISSFWDKVKGVSSPPGRLSSCGMEVKKGPVLWRSCIVHYICCVTIFYQLFSNLSVVIKPQTHRKRFNSPNRMAKKSPE